MGAIEYEPNGGYWGSDEFVYRLENNAGESVTVRAYVTVAPDMPTATGLPVVDIGSIVSGSTLGWGDYGTDSENYPYFPHRFDRFRVDSNENIYYLDSDKHSTNKKYRIHKISSAGSYVAGRELGSELGPNVVEDFNHPDFYICILLIFMEKWMTHLSIYSIAMVRRRTLCGE